MAQYPRPTDVFIPNHRGLYGKDVRNLFSGKDGMLFDEDGKLLSSAIEFQSKVNVVTTDYQPLGSAMRQAFITGFSVTLTITQCIIEDDQFIKDVQFFFHKNRHAPMWTLQSVLYGYNDTESHYIFRDCVPTGDLDLHNLTVGDIVRRTWTLQCNAAPEVLRTLSYTDN